MFITFLEKKLVKKKDPYTPREKSNTYVSLLEPNGVNGESPIRIHTIEIIKRN